MQVQGEDVNAKEEQEDRSKDKTSEKAGFRARAAREKSESPHEMRTIE